MREILETPIFSGLYEQPHHQNAKDETPETPLGKLIGLARSLIDHVTFSYVIDVWVDSKYQVKGLGSWLVKSL
jgi:hypothetical protein